MELLHEAIRKIVKSRHKMYKTLYIERTVEFLFKKNTKSYVKP